MGGSAFKLSTGQIQRIASMLDSSHQIDRAVGGWIWASYECNIAPGILAQTTTKLSPSGIEVAGEFFNLSSQIRERLCRIPDRQEWNAIIRRIEELMMLASLENADAD